MKPKEPLLAVILSIILPGLGQVYAGRLIRGITFFLAPWVIAIPSILYVINPNTTISPIWFVFIILWIIFSFYIIIDAYRSTKKYNVVNRLERKITFGKRVAFILGILIVAFVFNPTEIIGKQAASYIKQNYIQAFKFPSGSMSPTLLPGDRMFADKAIYKKSQPQRGDLIVFIFPEDRKKDFAKRVVGLPNETVEIKDGSILINGIPLTSQVFTKIYYYNRGEYGKEGQSIKVPENSYFVLGDNSASSHDSRYWGFVPRADILGKVYKIFYPFNRSGPISEPVAVKSK